MLLDTAPQHLLVSKCRSALGSLIAVWACGGVARQCPFSGDLAM